MARRPYPTCTGGEAAQPPKQTKEPSKPQHTAGRDPKRRGKEAQGRGGRQAPLVRRPYPTCAGGEAAQPPKLPWQTRPKPLRTTHTKERHWTGNSRHRWLSGPTQHALLPKQRSLPNCPGPNAHCSHPQILNVGHCMKLTHGCCWLQLRQRPEGCA